MEYFILSQDGRVTEVIRPVGISQLVKNNGLATESWDELDDLPVQLYLEEKGGREYVDFIEHPVLLVSERLKALLHIFEPKMFLKPVVLADQMDMRQELYWLMNPPLCDCLASESEFNKNETIKRLIIDRAKADGTWIFRVAGIMERLIIVNLAVAESMLRRDLKGIALEQVECKLVGIGEWRFRNG